MLQRMVNRSFLREAHSRVGSANVSASEMEKFAERLSERQEHENRPFNERKAIPVLPLAVRKEFAVVGWNNLPAVARERIALMSERLQEFRSTLVAKDKERGQVLTKLKLAEQAEAFARVDFNTNQRELDEAAHKTKGLSELLAKAQANTDEASQRVQSYSLPLEAALKLTLASSHGEPLPAAEAAKANGSPLEMMMDRLGTLERERASTLAASRPVEEAMASAIARLELLSERARPKTHNLLSPSGRLKFWYHEREQPFSMAEYAAGLNYWANPEPMIAQLRAELEEVADPELAISSAERTRRIAAIEVETARLQRASAGPLITAGEPIPSHWPAERFLGIHVEGETKAAR